MGNADNTMSIIISIIGFLLNLVWIAGFITIFATAKKKSTSKAGYIIEKIVNIIYGVMGVVATLFVAVLFLMFILTFANVDMDLPLEFIAACGFIQMTGYEYVVYIVFGILIAFTVLNTIMRFMMAKNYTLICNMLSGRTNGKQISVFSIVMLWVNIILASLTYIGTTVLMFIYKDDITNAGLAEETIIILAVVVFIITLVMDIFPFVCELTLMGGVKKRMAANKIA